MPCATGKTTKNTCAFSKILHFVFYAAVNVLPIWVVSFFCANISLYMILANHPCQASLCRRLSSWIWKPMNLHADYLRSMQGWKMKAICCSGSNTATPSVSTSPLITIISHHHGVTAILLALLFLLLWDSQVGLRRRLAATNCRQTHDKESNTMQYVYMTLWWHILDIFNSSFEPFAIVFSQIYINLTNDFTTVHCPLWQVALGVMLPEAGYDVQCFLGSLCCCLWSAKSKKGGKVKQDWRKWTKYRQNMTTGINISMMFVKMFVRCQKGHPACAKVSWKAPSNCESCYVFFVPTCTCTLFLLKLIV